MNSVKTEVLYQTYSMENEQLEDFIKRKNATFAKAKEENSLISMKDIGRKGKHNYIRDAWTFMPQNESKNKVFVFERLIKESFVDELDDPQKWRKGDIEYRIGYYIIGRIGRAKGKWVWGQFCPIIPQTDLLRLIDKAKNENVLI